MTRRHWVMKFGKRFLYRCCRHTTKNTAVRTMGVSPQTLISESHRLHAVYHAGYLYHWGKPRKALSPNLADNLRPVPRCVGGWLVSSRWPTDSWMVPTFHHTGSLYGASGKVRPRLWIFCAFWQLDCKVSKQVLICVFLVRYLLDLPSLWQCKVTY